jgi:hypothetical protein
MSDNSFPLKLDFGPLFESLGLTGLTEEEIAKYSKEIEDTVQERIMNRIVLSVTEEDAPKFDTMNEDEAILFLADRGVDILQVAEEETKGYIEELKANIQTAKEFISQKNNGSDTK